jgi:hypothetical protein
MKYSVACTPAADGELAAVWITAEDRSVITSAAREIDRALADAPLSHGESRDHDWRIIFVAPLGARYVVRSDDRTVTIVQFWTF